jgi:hypothetical protein
LSRLPAFEFKAVIADPRFSKLVDVARGQLEARSRPKELRSREIANMINGKI